MEAKELAEQALNKVREMMAGSTSGELETLTEFAKAFDAEIAVWDMHIYELTDED